MGTIGSRHSVGRELRRDRTMRSVVEHGGRGDRSATMSHDPCPRNRSAGQHAIDTHFVARAAVDWVAQHRRMAAQGTRGRITHRSVRLVVQRKYVGVPSTQRRSVSGYRPARRKTEREIRSALDPDSGEPSRRDQVDQ